MLSKFSTAVVQSSVAFHLLYMYTTERVDRLPYLCTCTLLSHTQRLPVLLSVSLSAVRGDAYPTSYSDTVCIFVLTIYVLQGL